MAGNARSQSLYPTVAEANPDRDSPLLSKSSSSSFYPVVGSESKPQQNPQPGSLYPSLDMRDLAENLFPDEEEQNASPNPPTAPADASEELIIKIPGAIVHLIDKQCSVELACGDLTIVCLVQGGNVIAVLARIGDEIQWPLAKDEATVKLDDSHYFFSLRVPAQAEGPDSGHGPENLLNYGLTFASKGQERLLREFDGILEKYSCFSVQKVSQKNSGSEVLDGSVAKEISPAELSSAPKKQLMEDSSTAYWTTLAPNVEDYSGTAARLIATGTGQLIRGILWCGDVTVDRLKWGDGFLKKRLDPNSKPSEISPEAIKRLKRVKRVSKMSEKVVVGVLSGVVKVSGFFTSSIVNSKAGKKFFGLLPGEIVLASLDGFGKVCDVVEVVGKNVLSTSSVVTTGLVSHRYGEQAGEMTHEGLDAAGHAIGTAWAVFKIRKALNPKSVIKTTNVVKTAAKAVSKEAKKGKNRPSSAE